MTKHELGLGSEYARARERWRHLCRLVSIAEVADEPPAVMLFLTRQRDAVYDKLTAMERSV